MSEHAAVFEHIDQHFDEYIAEIQRFLRQPGFSHTGEGIRECAELTREYLQSIGTDDAELVETGGHPTVFGHLRSKRPNAKTLIAYSHYDEVPVVPKDWAFPPLEARIVNAEEIDAPAHLGKVIVARASADYRGVLGATIMALKSMLAVTGDIPINIMWAIDGEEEIGAPHLDAFIEQKTDELMTADALWMGGMHQDTAGVMQIYRGYKGTAKVELEIASGEWGGTLSGKDLWSGNLPLVDAPLWRMIRLLNTLVDENDRVTIDGMNELIRPFSTEEEAELAILTESFDEELWKETLGIASFKHGRPGRELFADYVMGAMLNVVGIVGGYTGPRVFTTLPMNVVAKIDIRFPPNITYADIPRLLRAHLDRRGYQEVEVRMVGGYEYSRTPASDPIFQAALRACRAHDCEYVIWPTKPSVAPFSKFNQPPLNKPVCFVGMGHGRWDHRANEYITVEGVRDFMKYVVTFLNEWANG